MNASATIPASAQPASPPDMVAELVARNFDSTNGELLVGGAPINELAKRYGTPLFVYDQQMLERQWRLLRETYPDRFSLHYSVKANPNQEILKFFLGRGVGLEIASVGELHQALAAGCSPANILFAGPGKTVEELATALAAGIGEIHVESLTEARRLAQLAAKNQRKVKIALRVNPAAEVEGGGMRMGAKPVAFGLDEDQLDALLDQLQGEPWLDVVGLHLYVGTQILDHDTLLRQYRAALDIARRISARIGKPLETIDFGGGLGVPYFAHERRLDTAALKLGLEKFVKEVAADPAISSARLIVEPGRFLVAESGIYLAEIVDIKMSRGKKFAITNGGMHHHLAASGNLGQTIKRNFPVALVNKLDKRATEEVEVVGPLCTPLDVLARSIKLPLAEVGDLVGVFQSGAYARAASPLGFLSHPSPPEVLVNQGCHRLVRRRGGVEDYLSDQ